MPLKYEIDPWDTSIQGTICATLRAIWREADAIGNSTIKDLTAVAFDKANRMDRKLKKYRKRFIKLPIEIREQIERQETD